MSNQPSQEVQLLLAAEKRASEKVAEARKRKAQLLKKAKEEAAADIEQYKAERQIVFNKYETEHIGSKDEIAKKIDRETTERLDTMAKRMKTNQRVIVNSLMDNIAESIRVWNQQLPTIGISNV